MKTLDEIASLHESMYPELAEFRRSSATDEQLKEIWARVGRIIPELDELLRWRDGEDADSFLLGCAWQLLPIDKMLDRYDSIAGQEIFIESDIKELNGVDYWPDEWIPFVEWNSEVVGIVDCRSMGKAVIGVNLSSGYAAQWATSMSDFFEGALRDLVALESLSVDRLMRSVEKN